MEDKILTEKYGRIYDTIFKHFDPPVDLQEVTAREEYVKDYLRRHPEDIFKTNNITTINNFDIFFDRDNYSREVIEKYNQARKDWELRNRGGVMSKVALSNILDHMSFLDLVNINTMKEFRKIMKKTHFWENKLNKLDREDGIDYQNHLNIYFPQMVVLLVMGIKELMTPEGKKNLKKKYLTVMEHERFSGWSKWYDFVYHIYYSNELLFDNSKYNKDFPKIIAHLLPFLHHIRILQITNIQLEEFTVPFGVNNTLEELILTGDRNVTTFPAYLIANLKSLIFLKISNTNIHNFPENMFNGFTTLIHLDLSYNRIANLHPGIFKDLVNLEILDLSANQISSLHKDIFQNLEELRKLDLFHNNLPTLPKGIFRNLDKLDTLNLSQNKLTTINRNMFRHLISLKRLNLVGIR